MSDKPVEHLDVLVVGAGLSGVGAGAYLARECPWADYEVFEARAAIGGTWDLFRYPGIRSDSDMFTLGYSFKPWNRENSIADGEAIREYIVETAQEYGIDNKIRFSTKVVSVDWSTADAHWVVTAERVDTHERFQITANFVFGCSGYYRYDHGYEPEFPGRAEFPGTIVHPQHWPEDLDYVGKKIVVIGSGATAVTLIPSMAKTAGHVTMLQRSPGYIFAAPAKDPIAQALRRLLPERANAPVIRWFKALGTQASYFLAKARPEIVKRAIRRQTERLLPEGYDIDKHFTPSYNPWDQRVCLVPNGDLFKAISDGSASVVTDHIERFDATGIMLKSGVHLDADIIVTATGLEVLFFGGIAMSVDGDAVQINERLSYKGMMLEGVPNLAFALGYANASWTLKADLACGYVTKLLNHMRDTGLRQCTAVAKNVEMTEGTMFGLNSGYLNRAQGRLPRQGKAFPWRVSQSYLVDYRNMRLKGIHDDAMQFTNPVRSQTVVGA